MAYSFTKNPKITDLGTFEIYEHEEYPENVPEGVLFSRRVSDGVDWYSLVHKPNGVYTKEDSFVYATCDILEDGTVRLQAVQKDPQRLFPGRSKLLKIGGYTGTDPQKDLKLWIWSPEDKTLTPPAPPEPSNPSE